MSPIHDSGMETARKRVPVGQVSTAMPENTRQRLLQRAAKVLGQSKLAERLNVTPQTLDLWMRGLARMPDRKLLELAAILDERSDDPP